MKLVVVGVCVDHHVVGVGVTVVSTSNNDEDD